jgi:plastocyanin
MAQDSTSNDAASVTANARAPSSTSNQASSTSSAPAQTHTVQVGLADHKFNPNVTEAEVGDVSNFHKQYP